MFNNNILYEDNIIVSLIMTENPYGISGSFKSQLGDGLRVYEIYMGYMEVVDVESILKASGIEEKIIFYGLEDIASENLIWNIYSIIKRNTPAFVLFYKLPSHKLHGVLSRMKCDIDFSDFFSGLHNLIFFRNIKDNKIILGEKGRYY